MFYKIYKSSLKNDFLWPCFLTNQIFLNNFLMGAFKG